MSEYILQLIAGLKLVWVGIFAMMYGAGGISNKWIRRFLGAFWMGVGVLTFSLWQDRWHWFYVFYPLLLMGGLHLGYGADRLWDKIRRRAIYGLALSCCAIPLCIGSGLWILFCIHCLLCISSSVILGVFNPTASARDEEVLIATLSTVCVLFLI